MTTRFLVSGVCGWGLVALLVGAAGAEVLVVEGVVRSEERASIKSPVLGVIRRVAVKEGDAVRRGQLLVEIQNDTNRAQVEAAEAEVWRANAAVAEEEVRLEAATREHERNSKIPDLIPARELDLSRDAVRNSQSALRVRQEELMKAHKQLEVTQATLRETRLLAPFDSVVGRVHLREGEVPKIAEEPVLDLISLEKLYVEVPVPLAYLDRLRPGVPVSIEVEGDTGSRRAGTGSVILVYPEVDPATRMFRIKVSVPPKGDLIRPGMFAKISTDLPAKRP